VQNAGAERRSLASAGLGLLDDVVAAAERHDAALLDRRGLLKTCKQPPGASGQPRRAWHGATRGEALRPRRGRHAQGGGAPYA
jgi:hypothetical protein